VKKFPTINPQRIGDQTQGFQIIPRAYYPTKPPIDGYKKHGNFTYTYFGPNGKIKRYIAFDDNYPINEIPNIQISTP